jgi:hypothetical protein
MTSTSAVGPSDPYYQIGAFSHIPPEALSNIFLRLEFRDLYCVSLGNRQLHALTFGNQEFSKNWLEKHFPTCYQRSRDIQKVDDAALCRELAIRKENIHRGDCTEFFLQCTFFMANHALIKEQGFVTYSVKKGMLRTWNCEGQLIRADVLFHQSAISSLQLDDQHLVICSSKGFLQIYSHQHHLFLSPLFLEGGSEKMNPFYKYRDRIVADLGDGTVKLWNSSGSLPTILQASREGAPSSTCFYMDKNYVVQGLDDGTIRIWNCEGLLLKNVGKEGGAALKRAISYLLIRGGLLFVGTASGIFTLWDLENYTLVRSIELNDFIHDDTVNYAWKVADDYLIATANRMVKIWDLASVSNQPIQQFIYSSPIYSTSMRGNRLLVATRDSGVSILDFAPPSLLADLHIVTPKEYQEKLGCSPLFLSRVGICSLTDLQQLGPPLCIESQTTRLKAYLDQPDLLDIWKKLKTFEWSNIRIYTLSALLKERRKIDPFKLANYF